VEAPKGLGMNGLGKDYQGEKKVTKSNNIGHI